MEKERITEIKGTVAPAVKLLGFLCPLIYFASYLTRKDYSIVMDAIISAEGLKASTAGLVETLGVISYGVGQIISGILGDRFKPHRMIMCGLFVTVVCNLFMPVVPVTLRGGVWFVNGFAQSMLWPPMVRIMAGMLDSKRYNTVAANVNVAGIAGTIFIYLSSSLLWLRLL
ncbi:MAG: MFS transporter, partial [Lachnospiraceae bacterium]|nr:MFS transporter [Lachnospiraceae bacterium]